MMRIFGMVIELNLRDARAAEARLGDQHLASVTAWDAGS
jgi:hypothetical protein